ncbi:cupin domain-containing protein [Nocardioides sp. zg-DK7169]|uniref:cupin domain-containing protein n=1 Tax=Nocardioides sp. zg-DK7169 TaxID=2736600 RepID=UPI001C12D3B6|nr:cupin domain-containing protein [Nocardioides sp. zg-DK7169]
MTDAAAVPSSADIESLEQLYGIFDDLSMEGGWHRRFPALWAEPRKNLVPYRWKYDDIQSVLDAAGRLVDHSMADRRNVTMRNPVEGNEYATVRTLVAAYQLIRPGETADCHRHTPAALRIILDGKGTYTVVNGHRVEMRPGDVLLTPSTFWHSHSHESDADGDDCYWVDILDVPLIHLLEPMFFKQHPDRLEADPVDVDSSPLAFRWEDSLSRLDAAEAPADGLASKVIELGEPAMPTISIHVHRLDAGFTSQVHQTTANSIFTVVEGSGALDIDGETITWERGDVIAVPSWRPYSFRADTDAHLVRCSDEAVLKALGLLRTEAL